MLERLLLIGVGAAGGAICRYGLGLWVAARLGTAFPYGTLLINMTGSFLLGIVVVLAAPRGEAGAAARLLLGVGFCGGYTTFSTFAVETLALLESRALGAAVLNILLSVTLSLLAAIAGVWLARLIQPAV